MNSNNTQPIIENGESDEEESVVVVEYINTTMDPVELRILNVLKNGNIPENGLDTLEIAKKVIGPNGTKGDVNRSLYRLADNKLIVKVMVKNKARPHWKIV